MILPQQIWDEAPVETVSFSQWIGDEEDQGGSGQPTKSWEK